MLATGRSKQRPDDPSNLSGRSTRSWVRRGNVLERERLMTVKIGLVGSGFVATFYMQGLAEVPNQQVMVVCSTDQRRARAFAETWGIPEFSGDVDSMLARADIDLVLLAVPNQFHKDLAVKAARAGKNVVVTKPLARNAEEAAEMLRAVREAGVLHGYAETEVFAPAVMRARKMIEDGAIGDVLTVRSREAHGGPHAPHFWNGELAGGGALMDMGCHTIEAARYFIGKSVAPIEGLAWGDTLVHGDKTTAEDNAVALIRFAGGQLGHMELSWTARGGLDLRNEVYGTAGAIFTDVTRGSPISAFALGNTGYLVEKADLETGWVVPVPDEARVYGYQEEMKHFVECVAKNTMPRETFEDGYVVNTIIDALYRSMKSKRWEPIEVAAL
jgi:predicted dehydrogenase